VIGVLGEELLDLGAVGLDLALEHAQHPDAGECQPANSLPRSKISRRLA
jgi:hypothetical protein